MSGTSKSESGEMASSIASAEKDLHMIQNLMGETETVKSLAI